MILFVIMLILQMLLDSPLNQYEILIRVYFRHFKENNLTFPFTYSVFLGKLLSNR